MLELPHAAIPRTGRAGEPPVAGRPPPLPPPARAAAAARLAGCAFAWAVSTHTRRPTKPRVWSFVDAQPCDWGVGPQSWLKLPHTLPSGPNDTPRKSFPAATPADWMPRGNGYGTWI